MERITVVIPAKDAAAHIGECLESLAAQRRKPDRVVLVDDHSRDETVARAEAYTAKLPLTIIRAPDHVPDSRGAAVARNAGAKYAGDGFVFFCDADVILLPDALSRLAMALEAHPNAAFAYGSFVFGAYFRAPKFTLWLLRWYNYISTMSMIRVRAFPGFDESLTRFQDWDLWLRLAETQKGIRVRTVIFQTTRERGSMSYAKSDILEREFRARRSLPTDTVLRRIVFKFLVRVYSLL